MSVTNHRGEFDRRYREANAAQARSYNEAIAAQVRTRQAIRRRLLLGLIATVYAVLLAAMFYGAWQLAQAGVLGGGQVMGRYTQHNRIPVEVSTQVDVDVTAWVSADELLDGLDEEGLAALSKRLNPNIGMALKDGTSRTVEDLVERAFVDLRHRSDLPQSLKDLFWNGFGRAMA